MRRTYQYRLYPTPSQRKSLRKILECCRWVYNQGLEVRREAWQDHQTSLSRYETVKMIPQWKREQAWLKEGHAQAMQEALKRLDLAFQAFFRRVKAGEKRGAKIAFGNSPQPPGYPRFRSQRRYDSFTYPQEKGNWRFLANGRLRLSKIGDVKMILHRPLEGECKTLTLRRDSLGNWYACFSCIIEPKPLPPTGQGVGIDLGLTTFAVLSDGKEIQRQRWMPRDAQDIARLQRKKERRLAEGSPERQKAVRALQHAYRRSTNRRKNESCPSAISAHQESRKLVNAYQFIVFEDLAIQDLQSKGNKTINRGIADVAWDQFVRFTTYKAEWAGREVALVDPRNTTQICSGCGELVPKDLQVRKHECSHCGLKMSRDRNAALNILARGLASLGTSPGSYPVHGVE